uniref:Uncharacterized protein n=1 Tax=Streptococcus mutans TaxID=1309 RepID=O68587_STRMG|nr:unknown [Streptococcus mutans]
MLAAQSFDIRGINMLNTQLLEVLGTKTFDVQEDLFEFNITDTIVLQASDSPDTHSIVKWVVSISALLERSPSVSIVTVVNYKLYLN